MRPTRANVKDLIQRTRSLMRRHFGTKTENLLYRLNPILRGWAHQFRHLVASKTFGYLDHCIFGQLWRWARRRHNNKGDRWIKARYFSRVGNDRWLLNAKQVRAKGRSQTIVQFRMSSLPIRRHIKVRAEARYHDARYAEYFKERCRQRRRSEHWDLRTSSPRQLELSF